MWTLPTSLATALHWRVNNHGSDGCGGLSRQYPRMMGVSHLSTVRETAQREPGNSLCHMWQTNPSTNSSGFKRLFPAHKHSSASHSVLSVVQAHSPLQLYFSSPVSSLSCVHVLCTLAPVHPCSMLRIFYQVTPYHITVHPQLSKPLRAYVKKFVRINEMFR